MEGSMAEPLREAEMKEKAIRYLKTQYGEDTVRMDAHLRMHPDFISCGTSNRGIYVFRLRMVQLEVEVGAPIIFTPLDSYYFMTVDESVKGFIVSEAPPMRIKGFVKNICRYPSRQGLLPFVVGSPLRAFSDIQCLFSVS